MARGKSVIDVLIIGDAKKLQGAFKDADAATGGLLKTAAKIGGATAIVSAGVDFVGDALKKVDNFEDGFDRLAGNIGEIDAQKVKDIAFDLSNIGLSADEVGTLAANFSAFASAAQVSAPAIAALTPKLLDVAVAVSAKTGKTLDEVITDIGKAVQGQQRPVSEYGLVIDKALNPDDQLRSILDQLKTKFGDAKDAIGDVAGAQDILTAKWDNFGVRVGENLEGPIHDLQLGLIFLADDTLPKVGAGFDTLGDKIGVWGKDALNPIALVTDAIGGIGDALRNAGGAIDSFINGPGALSESEVRRLNSLFTERNSQGRP